MQALQHPPIVDALPVFENLPGRQEINKKLQECIHAQTVQASIKHKAASEDVSLFIKKANGIQRANEIPNKITEPLASLLNSFFLCNALTAKRLIIENIGKATDTRIELSLDLLNASIYNVGSHDSIPSLIKPIAIIHKKIGKTPLSLNMENIDFP